MNEVRYGPKEAPEAGSRAIEAFRIQIPPVPTDVNRPLWSVMIPTYNCAEYLRDTLESVLAQDPGPDMMQVEVVDDASTKDDPGRVVEDIGGGRVEFHRQDRNLGHVRNFDSCLLRSRGRLVHLLHGDDAVLDGFYRRMQSRFESTPEIGAAFCRDIRIDENGQRQSVSKPLQQRSGVLENWLQSIAVGQRLQAPAMTVRRKVYETLGGFDRRVTCYGEDWEMWVRIAAHYPVWYEAEPLAAYRLHSGSLTSRTVLSGASARDYRRVIEINRDQLPRDRRDELSRRAAVNFARACVRRGWRAIGARDSRAAVAQFREGFRTSLSWRVFAEFVYDGLRLGARGVRRNRNSNQ